MAYRRVRVPFARSPRSALEPCHRRLRYSTHTAGTDDVAVPWRGLGRGEADGCQRREPREEEMSRAFCQTMEGWDGI